MTENKRLFILQAAGEVLAAKGKKATIGEIASAAGVTVSAIYHYFRNKEDLIFSVIDEGLVRSLDELNNHLAAIRDPVSKLSKCIWLQFKGHQDHPVYTTLLMFECRANSEFREHKAFKGIKRWSDTVLGILAEGIETGAFSSNLNIILARDAILGLLDVENIFSLIAGDPEQSGDDIDKITDMVLAMISSRDDGQMEEKGMAERILLAAEQVFAINGFENATITGIANLAGVSEGAIYEYYKNKEDVLFSIMDARFENQIGTLGEIFQITSPLRKLRRFFKYHFMLHASQPMFTRIFLRDGLYNQAFYKSQAYSRFMEHLEIIDDIMIEGQKAGVFRADLDRRVYKNLFLGTFAHISLRWQFKSPGADIDKICELNQMADLLTGFLSPPPQN